MNRIFKLTAILALCFIMTGCGKSRLAKEADKAIESIGTVTLASLEKIQAAQQAYDKLTYEEKQTVDFVTLEDAKQKYNYLLYAGRWKNLNQHGRYIKLGENGEFTSLKDDKEIIAGTYKTVGDTVDIIYSDENGESIYTQAAYTITTNNERTQLIAADGAVFVREKECSSSVIEITKENYLDYFDVEFKFNIKTNPHEKVVTKPREVSYHGYLILKPEYARRLCSAAPNTNNYLKIVYNNSLEYQIFDWDVGAQNLVYKRTRLRQNPNSMSDFVSEIKQSDLWENMMSSGTAQYPFSFHYGSYVKDEYDIGIAYDYEIIGIGGSLQLYDQPLYSIN